jgi:hypothetical protein
MHAFVPARNHTQAAARGRSAHATADKAPELESPELTLLQGFAHDLSRISIYPPLRTVVEDYPGAQTGSKTMPPPQNAGASASQKSSPEGEKSGSQSESAAAPHTPEQPLLLSAVAPQAPSTGVPHARVAPKLFSGPALQALPLGRGVLTTGPPTGTTLANTRAGSGKRNALGYTDWPKDYKAPDFDFNTTIRRNTRRASFVDKPSFSRPTKKTNAFEGASKSLFAAPGKYATGDKENGKDVFWNLSPATSDLARAAEQEHCDDFAEAYRISLKDADDVVNAHIVGKSFGPAATSEQAEKLVRDTIASNLAHPQLGSDKSQWASKYFTLCEGTQTRDTSNWHGLGKGQRTEDPAGITYEIVKGNAQIPGPASNTIIKY